MSAVAAYASSSTAGDAQRFAHFNEITTAFEDAAPNSDDEVAIPEFLNAMLKFLRVFDALASIGDFVKKDIEGNIAKLGKAASKHGCATVTSLLSSELSDSASAQLIRAEKGIGSDSGTVATLWMKRTMQFVNGLMRNLLADSGCSLADAARKSYGENLGLAHPWVTRRLFDAGLRFAPARTTFYKDLGGGSDRTKIEKAIQNCFASMEPVLTNLLALYQRHELELYIK